VAEGHVRVAAWFAWVNPLANRDKARAAIIEFSAAASGNGNMDAAFKNALEAGLVLDNLTPDQGIH
jgi:hypothetical protein